MAENAAGSGRASVARGRTGEDGAVTWEVGALVVGVAGSVVAPPRVRAWVVASAVAAAALLLGVVPWSVFGDAVDALAAPLAFLVLAARRASRGERAHVSVTRA
jgi:hypothetical protein